MRASLPTNILIERDICKDVCTTIADATQIHQIMLNLCTNAAHAMEPNGGVLTIRLEPVMLEDASLGRDRWPVSGQLSPDWWSPTPATASTTPSSIGFSIPISPPRRPEKAQAWDFRSFMASSRQTAGAIRAFSHPGRFTEFHLYLPVVDMVVEAEPAIFDQQHLPGGQEHIMIVDDEEMLIDMMRQVLEQLGYTVTAFTE